MNLLPKINSLINVPMERWQEKGVRLRAVSANSNGRVNSGILSDGNYFYRKYETVNGVFTENSQFVISAK